MSNVGLIYIFIYTHCDQGVCSNFCCPSCHPFRDKISLEAYGMIQSTIYSDEWRRFGVNSHSNPFCVSFILSTGSLMDPEFAP